MGRLQKYDCYMAVTPDEDETPIIVADSLAELARKTGRTKNNISSMISHRSSGRNNGFKVIGVCYEGDEDED